MADPRDGTIQTLTGLITSPIKRAVEKLTAKSDTNALRDERLATVRTMLRNMLKRPGMLSIAELSLRSGVEAIKLHRFADGSGLDLDDLVAISHHILLTGLTLDPETLEFVPGGDAARNINRPMRQATEGAKAEPQRSARGSLPPIQPPVPDHVEARAIVKLLAPCGSEEPISAQSIRNGLRQGIDWGLPIQGSFRTAPPS